MLGLKIMNGNGSKQSSENKSINGLVFKKIHSYIIIYFW